MTEPVEEVRDRLFRDEAVRWAGGRRFGDPARVASRTTPWLYRLLVVALIGAVAAGLLIRVPVSTQGNVVVDVEHGTLTALFPRGVEAHPGDRLSVYLGQSTQAIQVRADTVTQTANHQVEITAHVPESAGSSVSGRAYIHTGSTFLLRYVVTSP